VSMISSFPDVFADFPTWDPRRTPDLDCLGIMRPS
jgi:hypothetical protein